VGVLDNIAGYVKLNYIWGYGTEGLNTNGPENVGASTSHNPMGLHGLFQRQFYLFYACYKPSALVYFCLIICNTVRLKKVKLSPLTGRRDL
jgi:hypothetical protein